MKKDFVSADERITYGEPHITLPLSFFVELAWILMSLGVLFLTIYVAIKY